MQVRDVAMGPSANMATSTNCDGGIVDQVAPQIGMTALEGSASPASLPPMRAKQDRTVVMVRFERLVAEATSLSPNACRL
jgi:hypothetical protein